MKDASLTKEENQRGAGGHPTQKNTKTHNKVSIVYGMEDGTASGPIPLARSAPEICLEDIPITLAWYKSFESYQKALDNSKRDATPVKPDHAWEENYHDWCADFLRKDLKLSIFPCPAHKKYPTAKDYYARNAHNVSWDDDSFERSFGKWFGRAHEYTGSLKKPIADLAPGLSQKTLLPGIAILVGEGSRIVVVDADSPSAVVWCLKNLPPTIGIGTTRGLHLYYRWTKNAKTHYFGKPFFSDPFPKLDVKATGHVMGPGTINHKSALPYALIGDWSTLDDLPEYDPDWLSPFREARKYFLFLNEQHCSLVTDPGTIRHVFMFYGLVESKEGEVRPASLPVPMPVLQQESGLKYDGPLLSTELRKQRAVAWLAKNPHVEPTPSNAALFRIAGTLCSFCALGLAEVRALLSDWNRGSQIPAQASTLKKVCKAAIRAAIEAWKNGDVTYGCMVRGLGFSDYPVSPYIEKGARLWATTAKIDGFWFYLKAHLIADWVDCGLRRDRCHAEACPRCSNVTNLERGAELCEHLAGHKVGLAVLSWRGASAPELRAALDKMFENKLAVRRLVSRRPLVGCIVPAADGYAAYLLFAQDEGSISFNYARMCGSVVAQLHPYNYVGLLIREDLNDLVYKGDTRLLRRAWTVTDGRALRVINHGAFLKKAPPEIFAYLRGLYVGRLFRKSGLAWNALDKTKWNAADRIRQIIGRGPSPIGEILRLTTLPEIARGLRTKRQLITNHD